MTTDIPQQFAADVRAAAKASGLPISVVAAQINLESGFNPQAVSPTGAEGIAQFEPSTWTSWGTGSPFNPADAFRAYGRFMHSLLGQFHGDVRDALAAYNAGPGNIQAGYGYADTILSNAGEGISLTAAGGTGGGAPAGSHASWWSAIWDGIKAGFGVSASIPGNPAGAVSDTAQSLLVLASPLEDLVNGIDWLFHPNHWIRIMAGVSGGTLVAVGAFQLSHTGSEIPVSAYGVSTSVGVPQAASLPMGVLFVGVGGILLFVAFHNLPDSVTSFPDFLGFLSDSVKAPKAAA